jgi:hypothetical protein
MRTRITIAICLFCVALAGHAQTTKVFTSPDATFRFEYGDVLENCTPQPTTTTPTPSASGSGSTQAPSVPRSCMVQGEACDGPGSGGTTKACFAYPNEKYEGSQFVAASFYVSEIDSDKTKAACVKGSHDWSVIKPGTITSINHITFEKFEIGDNWTSGGQYGPAYRTFHNGRCYEIGIQIFISRAVYDDGPAKNLAKEQWSEIERSLNEPLDTFVFLK